MDAGTGNDTLSVQSGAGADVLAGGENAGDNDSLWFDATTGGVNVTFTGAEAGTYVFDTGGTGNFTQMEFVWATEGNDVLDGSGAAGGINADGFAGADRLIGSAQDDRLAGGEGADTLTGGAGNDLLAAGGGVDNVIFRGPVTDYSFDYGPDGALIVTDSVAGRDGIDTVTGGEYVTFNGITYNLVMGDDRNNTTLQGPEGQPALIIAHDGNDWGGGHATSDVIFGGAGDDTLVGGAGNDTLLGEADNDLLHGDGGDDSLLGGGGTDTLQGGAGNDVLAGGSGADVLAFETGSGSDVITDFDYGDANEDGLTNDRLDVSDLTDGLGNQVKTFDVTLLNDGDGNTILVFPGGERVTVMGLPIARAAQPGMLHAMGIPCFAAGTRILTPQGARAVEDIAEGDLVVTAQGRREPVLWHGRRTLTAADLADHPHLRPIRLRAGRFGNTRDLTLSPQHGVVVGGQLVRARHLALWGPGARVARGLTQVTYHHLMLPQHALIRAEGVLTESFYPGRMAMAALTLSDRVRVAQVILRAGPDRELCIAYGPRCQPVLTGQEARSWLREGRVLHPV